MTRAFQRTPVDPALLDGLVDLASRSPSAGKSQGWHLLVLEQEQTALFWDCTLPPERRSGFAWPHLLDAPVIALMIAEPEAYLIRYSEPDKAATGLGASPESWPVPYWTVDASMAMMTLLLGAEQAGLGALLFGVFNGEAELRKVLGIEPAHVVVSALALGWPAPETRPGRSASRARRTPAQLIRRP